MVEVTIKFPQLTGRSLLAVGAPVFIAVAVLITMLTMHHPSSGMQLSSIVGPVSGFTSYFFSDQIPDQYVINKDHSLFTGQLLQVTLDKLGKPSLVLTEQALPDKLSASTLLQGGTSIKGAVGPATVNAVDEHVVGTLLPSGHHTLVLVTGPQNANPSDVADLIKALTVQ